MGRAEGEPYLLAEWALEQKMCQCFHGLITECTSCIVRPSTRTESVRGPQPILDEQPHEELNLSIRFKLPDFVQTWVVDVSDEVCVIGRGRGVIVRGCKRPADRIGMFRDAFTLACIIFRVLF